MDKHPPTPEEIAARKKAEAKNTLLIAIILGGLIVVMIAGMLAFDIYAEKQTGQGSAPAEAAER